MHFKTVNCNIETLQTSYFRYFEFEIETLQMDEPFLDENMQKYICAYIDGEMNSTVVEMFEVYLEDNPDIKAFVKDAQAGKNAINQLKNLKKP